MKNKYLFYSLVFLVSLVVHLIGLNKIGRTWDEQIKVDTGYSAWAKLSHFDFNHDLWKEAEDYPMVAKYIYGFFLGPQLIDVSNLNPAVLSYEDTKRLEDRNFILTGIYDRYYAVTYDFTWPRIISALFNSLAVLLTILIARKLVSENWSLLAGFFLLVSPRFVYLGQLVTYESLSVGLLTLTVLSFNNVLEHPQRTRLYIICGFILGLLIWIRYNNFIAIPFLIGWLIIHYFYKKKMILNWKLLLIPIIAVLFGVAIWPYLWPDIPKYLLESIRINAGKGIHPSLYFIQHLVFTTPVPTLIGLVLGIFFSFKEKKYWQIITLWWIVLMLGFFSVFSIAIGGTRYVSLIFPAVAMLAALGYYRLLKKKFVYLLVPIGIVSFWSLISSYPYYLDYYNILIGGTKQAALQGYDFSWWGEGQKEMGEWMNNNVPPKSSIGLIVTPKYVFPPLRKDFVMKGYVDIKTNADYVVVSRGDEWRLDNTFKSTYRIVHSVQADAIPLLNLWKRK